MDRISDDDLDLELDWNWHTPRIKSLLTELRERRAAEKAPCPEHAKMVAEWDTYEMGRDDSSAAPYWHLRIDEVCRSGCRNER